jgi:acetyl-CoA carboxylase biotin carboxyl carrier protein
LADEPNNTPGPFDVETIRHLIRLMSRHDLSEIDLRNGEMRIRLLRGRGHTGVSLGPLPAPAPLPAPTANAVAAPPAPAAPAAPAKKLIEIKSPAVGTFYAQEKEGAPPYVTVGSRVSPSTVVCIIEAMKVFNEVTADCSGVIAEIVAENKQFVEFGTVLFRVDPTA